MSELRSVESEQQARESLAALYRILDRYGMSDLANQEVGARIGEQPEHYLVHAYGAFYEEVTASSLVKIDQQGQPVEGLFNAWIILEPFLNYRAATPHCLNHGQTETLHISTFRSNKR